MKRDTKRLASSRCYSIPAIFNMALVDLIPIIARPDGLFDFIFYLLIRWVTTI